MTPLRFSLLGAGADTNRLCDERSRRRPRPHQVGGGAAVDARDFLSLHGATANFRVTVTGSPNFWQRWPSLPQHFTTKHTWTRWTSHERGGRMDADDGRPASLAVSSSRKEEKKRRQSNCLLRVTVTFCLVPGKGTAVLTLPGYVKVTVLIPAIPGVACVSLNTYHKFSANRKRELCLCDTM